MYARIANRTMTSSYCLSSSNKALEQTDIYLFYIAINGQNLLYVLLYRDTYNIFPIKLFSVKFSVRNYFFHKLLMTHVDSHNKSSHFISHLIIIFYVFITYNHSSFSECSTDKSSTTSGLLQVERLTLKPGFIVSIARGCVPVCPYGCKYNGMGLTYEKCTSCCRSYGCNTMDAGAGSLETTGKLLLMVMVVALVDLFVV